MRTTPQSNISYTMFPHPNFKSLVSGVSSSEDILGFIESVHQREFEPWLNRETSPWETHLWDENEDELRRFRIDVEKIDRLYSLKYISSGDCEWLYLTARLEYKGSPIFLELIAREGIAPQGLSFPEVLDDKSFRICHYLKHSWRSGNIFVTRNPNLFTKVITLGAAELESFYESLREDGYHVDPQTEHERTPPSFWRSSPSLLFLSKAAVSKNWDKLGHHLKEVPATLAASVEHFIKSRIAFAEHFIAVEKYRTITTARNIDGKLCTVEECPADLN